MLENNYSSKINFYFNNQYSLHDPIVEIEEGINDSKKDDKIKIVEKSAKKERKIKKKTTIKKRVKTKKATSSKEIKSNIENKNEKKDESKDLSVNTPEVSNENMDEKTGWWS